MELLEMTPIMAAGGIKASFTVMDPMFIAGNEQAVMNNRTIGTCRREKGTPLCLTFLMGSRPKNILFMRFFSTHTVSLCKHRTIFALNSTRTVYQDGPKPMYILNVVVHSG